MSEAGSSKRIRLAIEGGPTREFPGDRTFVIGRSRNADFSIPHPNLSREHVRLSLKDGEAWMEDLGSANGTFVQGQRVPAKSTVKLKPHYRVLLGTGSGVVFSCEVVEGAEPLADPEPKGDADLPTARERTLAAITRNQLARDEKSAKMELDFPRQHFPHEAKKEKLAEFRILEAKKQRVLEDIQYKEREIDDLRTKIRGMREEALKLQDQTESFKRDLAEQVGLFQREIGPLEARKADLEKCVRELDLIYEEKIDALETGFRELKRTLEESHAERMARADKDFKERIRRIDEEYAGKLESLEAEIGAVRSEGEGLRDRIAKENRDLQEGLRQVRADAERVEAERKLEQVRIDTETARLQGDRLKLENELEAARLDRDRTRAETDRLVERGKEAQASREEAERDLENLRRTVSEVRRDETKNLERIGELKSQVSALERNAEGIAETIRKAGRDADEIRNAAREAAETDGRARVQAAEAEAAARLEAAGEEARALRERSRAEATAVLEEKGRLADGIVRDAETRAAELAAEAKAGAERSVAEATAALDARRRGIESELAELRRKNDLEVRQVRANALADIESAKERETKEFNARLKSRVKSIGDRIDRVVGSKLSTQFGLSMDSETLKAFSEEIHEIVETVISPTKYGGISIAGSGEKSFASALAVDDRAQARAANYWRRVGGAAAVIFALIVGRIAVPEAYSWVGRKVGAAFEVKDNTDAVVKRMLRERQLAMTFVTDQDQRIRDSYTDNILYTEGFIEMKEDVETQKAWTLGLNRFFQSDLGLTEKAIVQFGSAEGRMMRELLEIRKGILPATSAVGIAKMREAEAGYAKEMRDVMRVEANWRRYLAYQRDFYAKYAQTLVNRAPASAASETR